MEQQLEYHIYKAYEIVRKIGKGSYGEVYQGFSKKTGERVAIKKICDAYQNITDAKRTYRQLNYLFQFHHPSIVHLCKIIPSKNYNHVYAVFEFVELDLAKAIASCKLEPIQRKYIAYQLLLALQYIHGCEVIHRDIKPSNVLIDANCDIKLCDFGLSRSMHSNDMDIVLTQYVAARWYRPPEVILGCNNYDASIDLWSVGCLMAELSLRQPLFRGTSTLDQLERIFKLVGMPNKSYIQRLKSIESKFILSHFNKVRRIELSDILLEASDSEVDLIIQLLKLQPRERIPISKALEHPYFQQVKELKYKFRVSPKKIVEDQCKTLDGYKKLIEKMEQITNFSHRSSKDPIEGNYKSQQFPEISTRDSNILKYQKQNSNKSVSKLSQKSKQSTKKLSKSKKYKNTSKGKTINPTFMKVTEKSKPKLLHKKVVKSQHQVATKKFKKQI